MHKAPKGRDSAHIINNFAVMLKTSCLHDIDNTAVTNQIERFVSVINTFISEEQILKIDLLRDFFYINNIRGRYPLEHLLNYDYLARELKRRELGTIVFKEDIDFAGVKAFVEGFVSSGLSDNPFKTIYNAVSHINSIEIYKLKGASEDAGIDRKKIAKKTYFNAVSFSKDVMDKAKDREAISVRSARRLIKSVVDMIFDEEQFMIGMTAIKDYDNYTFHHSVNVSILAVALGQKLGLSKKALMDLGVTALFHDIGKTDIPNEVLNKTTSFSDAEWAVMRKHPLSGARILLNMKPAGSVLLRSAIAAFEHHLHYNYTGYPKVRIKSEQDFFSKITAIADQYDALTSARVYRRTALPPEKVLGMLIEDSGTKIDPLLLKFFINMVGAFPSGTLVLLNTKELGIVCESNPLFVDRPKVRVIAMADGTKTDYIVDTSEKASDGNFVRGIAKTLDHNKYKINLAEYLM